MEKKAHECLVRGEFRRAFEGYKRLIKIDHEKYRDHFVTAGAGAFEEFLSNGQTKQAEILLKSLDGIAPTTALALLRIRLALATKGEAEASRLASGILDDPAASAAVRTFAADVLISIPPGSRGGVSRPETSAIDQALASAAAGQFGEVAAAMRDLPRQSPFSHWRFFFKAAVAHAEGDHETARKAISLLEGPCARMAQAWMFPGPASLESAVTLHGEAKLAENLPALLRADARSEYAVVFLRLAEYCRNFPSVDSGIASTLTDYVVAQIARHPFNEQSYGALKRKSKNPGTPPLAVFAIGRFVFDWLMTSQVLEFQDTKLIENVIAEARAAFPDLGPSAEACILAHYAAELLKRGKNPELSCGFEEAAATPWLTRVTAIAPEWMEPKIDLIGCLLSAGKHEKAASLIASVVAGAAQDAKLLTRLGKVCCAKNQFNIAAEILTSALAADPHNAQARELLIASAIGDCSAALRMKNKKAAAAAAELACSTARETGAFFDRPAMVALQCAVCMETWATAKDAKPFLDRAKKLLAEPCLSFSHFVVAQISSPAAKKNSRKILKNFFRSTSLEHVLKMSACLTAAETVLPDSDVLECEEVLAEYIAAAVARDPDWRTHVIPIAREFIVSPSGVFLLEELASSVGRKAPRDPITAVLRIADKGDPSGLKTLAKHRAKFEKQGMGDAVALCDDVRKLLENVAEENASHGPPGPPGPWYDGGFGFGGGNPPGGLLPELQKIVEKLFDFPRKSGKKKAASKKAASKKAAAKKAAAKKTAKQPGGKVPGAPAISPDGISQLEFPL